MRKAILGAVVAIAGCGGGGGGSDSGPGPLDKYTGNYTYCENNERVYATLAPAGPNTLLYTLRSEYFQNANCTGAVVGVETNSSGLTLTYTGTETGTVVGWPAATSRATYTVDKVSVSSPAITVALTGSGVSVVGGRTCVSYSNGRTCLEQTTIPAATFPGGLVLTDSALVLVTGSGPVYQREEAYPR